MMACAASSWMRRADGAMVILGITGSIGMGKTTACATIRRMGVPVHDSDAVVHRLLGPGGALVAAVGAAFEGVLRDGAVDRGLLGARVFADSRELARLEKIVHPAVGAAQRRFLRQAAARHVRLVVLDVPLLFEGGGAARCDATIVVSAPAFLQAQRVLARPGMTAARLRAILARQMPDAEKRRRADFVVPTGLGRALTLRRLREIVRLCGHRRGRKWPPTPYSVGTAGAARIHARNRH